MQISLNSYTTALIKQMQERTHSRPMEYNNSPRRSTIVTDREAWSVGLSVCPSVTVVSSVKTAAEPIKMPFGLKAQVGLRNHVLDGGPRPPWEGAILKGRRASGPL